MKMTLHSCFRGILLRNGGIPLQEGTSSLEKVLIFQHSWANSYQNFPGV
jgi:hypothetical protein